MENGCVCRTWAGRVGVSVGLRWGEWACLLDRGGTAGCVRRTGWVSSAVYMNTLLPILFPASMLAKFV